MQKKYKDIIILSILGPFFVIFYFLSCRIPIKAGMYPRSLIIIGFLLVLLLFLLVLFYKKLRKTEFSKEDNKFLSQSTIRLFSTIITTVLYVYILPKFGFVFSTIIFIFILMNILNSKYRFLYMFVAPTFTLVLYYIFGKLLKVWLP